MTRGEVDVRRLINIAGVLLSVFAACFVALQMEPLIGSASAGLSTDRDALRSDEFAFANLPQLERNRHLLAARYARVPRNVSAEFLRNLDAIARRRGVHVVLTSFKRDVEPDHADPSPAGPTDNPDARFFTSDHLTVTLRGAYADILRSIADLSIGAQIVRVDRPNITRDDGAVIATIPIAILEPIGDGP